MLARKKRMLTDVAGTASDEDTLSKKKVSSGMTAAKEAVL